MFQFLLNVLHICCTWERLNIVTSFIFFENVKPVHENVLEFISQTVNLPVDIRVEMLSTLTVIS